MNVLSKICCVVVALFVFASIAKAEVTLGPAIRSQISDILRTSMAVYTLNMKENAEIMKHIDTFFEEYVNLGRVDKEKNVERGLIRYRSEIPRNVAIYPPSFDVPGMQVDEPIRVFYIQEPQRRTFRKEIAVPGSRALPEKDVISIARDFIVKNKFFKATNNDDLGRPFVVSRKKAPVHDLKKTLTVFQRVQFTRRFMGQKVINSKQAVDIHPVSREIISYRLIDWSPVDETSAQKMPYISTEDVIARIKKAFEKSKVEYRVEKVRVGYYQSNELMFPVMVVHTTAVVAEDEPIPMQRLLIISLIKELPIEEIKKEAERPAVAK